MKIFLVIFILSVNFLVGQTCKALFSYGAQFEKVQFYNHSNLNNAHYYWNFGDGTSSNLKEPIHDFPSNGSFLVTLYVNDTINHCSDYFDLWLTITQNSSVACSVKVTDSIGLYDATHDMIKINDFPSNCSAFNKQFFMGGNWGGGSSNIFLLSKYPANHVSGVLYYNTNNLVFGIITTPNRMNRAKNYNSCSANFEFHVSKEDSTGQTIFFEAMNKKAISYKWYFTGFGNPIISYNDTASIFYSVNPYSSGFTLLPPVYLITVDQNGCRDSMIQNVSVRPKNVTYVGLKEQKQIKLNLTIMPNPIKDKFKLHCEQGTLELKKLSIANTLGQLVFILNEPKPEQDINVSYLATGIYYLKVESTTEQKTFKIIKE
jgi:hypothetical protein